MKRNLSNISLEQKGMEPHCPGFFFSHWVDQFALWVISINHVLRDITVCVFHFSFLHHSLSSSRDNRFGDVLRTLCILIFISTDHLICNCLDLFIIPVASLNKQHENICNRLKRICCPGLLGRLNHVPKICNKTRIRNQIEPSLELDCKIKRRFF